MEIIVEPNHAAIQINCSADYNRLKFKKSSHEFTVDLGNSRILVNERVDDSRCRYDLCYSEYMLLDKE